MSTFEKYIGIEIHTDVLEDVYHITYTEKVPIRNGYEFERKKIKVNREKIEKIVEEIIILSNN